MSKRKNIQDMQKLAAHYNGKCLSDNYINMRMKLKWQCEYGHEWETTPGNIKYNDVWCPYCAGNAKKTMQDMHQLAEANNGQCLSMEYLGDGVKLKWQCEFGHTWMAVPGSIVQGSWCPYCADNMKYNIEELRQFAKDKNGELLSTEYINHNVKLKWHCNIHNIDFIKSWSKIKNRNSWCPLCKKEELKKKLKKYTIEDMHSFAKSNGGKCLSNKYINSITKLRWECLEGHIWETTPKNIKMGHWCPECAKIESSKRQRGYTIQDMQQIAEDRGGKCLSKKYINANKKLEWKCKKGHVWETTPSKIMHSNQWCPYCVGKNKTIEDIKDAIKDRPIRCLSNDYKNAFSKLLWKCGECEKTWQASFNNIQGGSGCPYCASFKSEKQFRKIIEDIIGEDFPKTRPEWLINPETNYPLELDGYNKKLKLAFEYQGQQHFKPIKYYGGKSEFIKRSKRDQIKKELCKKNGVKLLCPRYDLDESEYKEFIENNI